MNFILLNLLCSSYCTKPWKPKGSFHGLPKQLHQMVAAVITGATSPTPGEKTTMVLTLMTLIMIFSLKRWVFKTPQNDSFIRDDGCLHLFSTPFPSWIHSQASTSSTGSLSCARTPVLRLVRTWPILWTPSLLPTGPWRRPRPLLPPSSQCSQIWSFPLPLLLPPPGRSAFSLFEKQNDAFTGLFQQKGKKWSN